MGKVVRIVLDLGEVMDNLTQFEAYKLCSELRAVQHNFGVLKSNEMEIIKLAVSVGHPYDKPIERLALINEQIHYNLDNIRVLENALLCHETKIFEKRTFYGMQFTVGLN
jgi:hypothetical protein